MTTHTQSNRTNLVLATDSYKVSHARQYPPGTSNVYSFFESRGGRYPTTTFFGLQYYLHRYLEGAVVTEADIDEAREMFTAHFGNTSLFNEAGWRRIIEVHGGRLPVRIKAVPEGLTVPTGNVLMTIENTDPELPWLTNYLETMLVQVWYPTTVATQSRAMRGQILSALEKSGDPAGIGFKLHDFGYRGSTSQESAAIGGAAHLVNFLGTDTFAAVKLLRDYYHEPMAGFSIPAAEHSTITSWGRDHERDAFANMLTQYPKGLVAVVSDSYDIWNACKNLWGRELREQVLERDGTLVVRPDSGPLPYTVVEVVDSLAHAFGSSVNSKGYRVLDPHVRVIQGDGITATSLPMILEALMSAGYSADNLAFGSGGGLLQQVDRDTQRFAFKCAAVTVDGVDRDVSKDPVTDPGKRSKAGRMKLIRTDNGYKTVRLSEPGDDVLELVFENGMVTRDEKLANIRTRALL